MKYVSRLNIDTLGRVPASRVAVFYRVETWTNGRPVADFTLKSEADHFAVADARAKGCRHDHKVSKVRLSR